MTDIEFDVVVEDPRASTAQGEAGGPGVMVRVDRRTRDAPGESGAVPVVKDPSAPLAS